jgi:hypothetical protein
MRLSVVSTVIVAGLAAIGTLQAQCTVADMKGDFATQPNGFLTEGPFAGPFAATGVIHFDGAGTFSGVATSSFNGGVIFPFLAVGFYGVTNDCFVTILETTLQIRFEGYLSATKNEVVLLQPDAGSISVNTLRRTLISDCTNASLSNNWAIEAAGNNIVTGGHFSQNGRLKFDGNGTFSGVTASSINGVIARTTVTGEYSVDSECNFHARIVDKDGVISHIFGTLFDGGSELNFIYSDDGLVIFGQARRAVDVN